MNTEHTMKMLVKAGVIFQPGLTSVEIERIELQYGFVLPPELKEFLMLALPVSDGFVDWRHGDKDDILERLSWPYEGICFDIENNGFWLEKWGPRPSSLDEAFAIAKCAVDNAPTLIPIYSHRYIPDSPNESLNPVFSVYQTDVIYYGTDLSNYLQNEFASNSGRNVNIPTGKLKHIEFWSELAESNQ